MRAPETYNPEDTATYVAATAALLGLVLAPEWRIGILASFETIAGAGRLLSSVALDEIESAPVFEA